jgi:hypothetical protein
MWLRRAFRYRDLFAVAGVPISRLVFAFYRLAGWTWHWQIIVGLIWITARSRRTIVIYRFHGSLSHLPVDPGSNAPPMSL